MTAFVQISPSAAVDRDEVVALREQRNGDLVEVYLKGREIPFLVAGPNVTTVAARLGLDVRRPPTPTGA